MSNIVEVLGSNIRKIRKNYGWTQEQLAEKSGISVPFMTQIELGRKSASLEVIEKIAQSLEVSYESLFKTEISDDKTLNTKLATLENMLIDDIEKVIQDKFSSLSV